MNLTLVHTEADDKAVSDAFLVATLAASKDPNAAIFAIVPNGKERKDACAIALGRKAALELMFQMGLRASHHIANF